MRTLGELQNSDRLRRAPSRRALVLLATEVAVLAVAWQLYRLGRYLARDQVDEAFDNADRVIAVERSLGLDIETGVQRVAVAWDPVIEWINRYYVYTHFAVMVIALLLAFALARPAYRRVRRVLIMATTVSLVMHTLFPLAPPRLVPSSGLTDTLATHGPRVYSTDWSESISNQFAAMPSMHVGWAVLAAWAIVSTFRSRWRWLVLVHPTVMAIAVMATGNHFLVDGLVGIALVAVVAVADHRALLASGRAPVAGGGAVPTVDGALTYAGADPGPSPRAR